MMQTTFCPLVMDKKLISLNGVFAVLKPAGETSAKTVDRVKCSLIRSALSKSNNSNQNFKKLSRQIKVGHGGTLDPMATGVLVIGLNGGCKELSNYLSGTKSYIAEARFGEHFDTLDCTGKLLQGDAKWMEKLEGCRDVGEMIREKFVGEAVMQVPPAFSAIHVNGKRAYDLARKESAEAAVAAVTENTEITDARAVAENAVSDSVTSDSAVNHPVTPAVIAQKEASFDLPARPVAINSLTYTPLTLPLFQLSVTCGGGCYIRSLIRDLASELGTLAVMTKLERCGQGVFGIDMCLKSEVEWADLEVVEEAIKRSKSLI